MRAMPAIVALIVDITKLGVHRGLTTIALQFRNANAVDESRLPSFGVYDYVRFRETNRIFLPCTSTAEIFSGSVAPPRL